MPTTSQSSSDRIADDFSAGFGRPPTVIAEAPGRIEFIGNHTDYNGGLVLGVAIEPRVRVALAPREDKVWRFVSGKGTQLIELPAGSMDHQAAPHDWLNYPLGVLQTFARFDRRLPAGFDYLVTSDLPSGAGLSSSAALELASALAFLALTQQELARDRLVELARYAENHFVGVPCGILDQGTSGFGQRDHLVWIDCAGPTFDTIPLPSTARFWVFNTHTKHALVDGLFEARHGECMVAARALGVATLREATLAMVATASLSPELRRRATHVIAEIERVQAAVAALRQGDLASVGRLLVASHWSSQSQFENSTPELDFLVDRVMQEPNVHGARLTGGGFGGAIMALTNAAFDADQARGVSEAYRAKFGHVAPYFTTRAADGARLVESR